MGIQEWVSDLSNNFLDITYDSAGIPMTKKKFAELELSLLHLQQNVEIPETHLAIHPVIQRAVEQVRFHTLLQYQTHTPARLSQRTPSRTYPIFPKSFSAIPHSSTLSMVM
jgi:hypothetical protein